MYAVSVRLKIITEHTARPGPSKAFLKPLVIYQYNIIQYNTIQYNTLHYNTYIFLKAHKNTADS